MPKTGQLKETTAAYSVHQSSSKNGSPRLKTVQHARKRATKKVLGKYIMVDLKISHGSPIFVGTNIKVGDVLDQVAQGKAWDTIAKNWHGKISENAIKEAIQLATKAFVKHESLAPIPAHSDAEIIERNAERLNKEALDVLKYQVIR